MANLNQYFSNYNSYRYKRSERPTAHSTGKRPGTLPDYSCKRPERAKALNFYLHTKKYITNGFLT